MADKVKTVKQLKLVAKFADGDDRTIAVDDPVDGLTKDEINAAEFVNTAKAVLIGDKAAAQMVGWKSAAIHESTTVYLDLTAI